MKFYKFLQNIDMDKENIVIIIITGKNIGSKLIVSDNEIIYTNNENVDWNKYIESITNIKESKKDNVITIGDEKIYFEYLRAANKVVVCGAGHISIPIIKMCKLLDLHTTVIDDRPKFANNAIIAKADKVICEPFADALNKIKGDSSTFFIIVTRGHRYDKSCLQSIVNKENAYIGMIGSKLRVAKVLNSLEEEGIEREKLNKVYTPIGLNIGAETPAEISVAIMAQIIDVKNKELKSSNYSDEIINNILDIKYKNIPKAMVTIVSRRGSAPREVGTKMVVLKDGTMFGTIGGGCAESNLRQKAFLCIENNNCQLVKVDMTGRESEEEGMICGGIIEVFIEPIK